MKQWEWNLPKRHSYIILPDVRCDGIPFEVRRNAFNAETRAALAEYEEMKAHPEKYKRYHSFADLVKDVDNEA